jgi:hypothetical protein
MGKLEKAWRLTKHKVVILVNPTKLVDYAIIRVHTMVTHATSHDVLVGGVVLYPLKFTLDYWEKTTYYQLRWYT